VRILIATPYLPWPLHEGGRVSQYRSLEALQASCEITLLFPAHCYDHEQDAAVLREQLPRVRIVPVRCYEPPLPPSPPLPPAKLTLRRFVGGLLRKMFPPPNRNSGNSAGFDRETVKVDLDPVPYYPFRNLHPHFIAAVDRELDIGYDILQAEFCEMLSLGLIVARRAKMLFIHHQLHFIYAERLIKSLENPSSQARYLANRMRYEEKAFLEIFDAAVVFSEVDAKLLKDFCPKVQVEVSPFPSPDSSHPSCETVQDCEAFVLLSSDYHPNVDGFIWFMEAVWPLIKAKKPLSKIEVVGKWSEEKCKQIPNSHEVHFVGYVDDISSALYNKLMIVPLWVGSGIRTKILAAWSAGCPVVSTSIGAEGLFGKNGKDFILANDANTFAEACLSLSTDKQRKKEMVLSALQTVEKYYSLNAVCQKRISIYEKLTSDSRP
jgi:glycosyltransferase involved in cell wall biosynthesis